MDRTIENLNERRVKFVDKIVNGATVKDVSDNMMIRFLAYWTETNEEGRIMRFEKEEIFSINRRLATFKKNKKYWEKQRNQSKCKIINVDSNEYSDDKL